MILSCQDMLSIESRHNTLPFCEYVCVGGGAVHICTQEKLYIHSESVVGGKGDTKMSKVGG